MVDRFLRANYLSWDIFAVARDSVSIWGRNPALPLFCLKWEAFLRSASFTAIDAPLIVGISYDPYRHYLFKAGEMHGIQLLAVHNVRFMVRLLQSIREALRQGRFAEARRQWLG